MEFAVNYTSLLADLVRDGLLRLDRFKCPAWPDLLAEARQTLPVYIHFPLGIGQGSGYPLDTETKAPADFARLADLRVLTGTPYINTHFVTPQAAYPGIPLDSTRPEHIRRVLDGALRDLEPLIARFGAENVLVENVVDEHGWLTLSILPEVIGRLLEETGCGFLFDLSHARLAAANLGLDPRAYSSAMPVGRIREIHVTGIQVLEGPLLELMWSIGDPYGLAETQAGKPIDHLPMTGDDWPELAWMLVEIAAGRWAAPWVVGFEYGGVGRFWEEVTDRQVYLEQLPRMGRMVHGDSERWRGTRGQT